VATYAQLLNARDTMNELAGTRLPPRLSLKVGRSVRTLFEALELLEVERKKFLKEHAYHTADGELELLKGEDGVETPRWHTEESEEEFRTEMKKAIDDDAGVIFIPILLKHFPKTIIFTPVETLALVEAGIVKE
jgi:hypothetical protein